MLFWELVCLAYQTEKDSRLTVTGGVGKSCLTGTYLSDLDNELMLTSMTAQFVQNVWIESYDPTIEDSYRKQIEVDVSNVPYEIHAAWLIGHSGPTMYFRNVRLALHVGEKDILTETVSTLLGRNNSVSSPPLQIETIKLTTVQLP